MIKNFIAILIGFPQMVLAQTSADPMVLFHPFDQTLSEVGKVISGASSNIDIAMYNMDVSDESPVVKALRSSEVQDKLRAGTLKIRFIFEGYGTDSDNRTRSTILETFGLDVRWLKGGRKVHHKFAVVDTGLATQSVITGSANWSLSSMRSYDENIMFWPGLTGFNASYQQEFNLLWSLSEEFGANWFPDVFPVASSTTSSDRVTALFNSANFEVRNGTFARSDDILGWTLTKAIVDMIDSADRKISIATTRIVLRPVYNAILRAAARGVKIDILVNQDQYEPYTFRANSHVGICNDEYSPECSTDQDFPWFLDHEDFPGNENVDVKVKFFSLDVNMTLAKQMHSKYILVDDEVGLSGSFNWSYSSEWSHIENMVKFEASAFPALFSGFARNHATIFAQGRSGYQPFVDRLESALETGIKIDCGFSPMALTFGEIDWLLAAGARHHRRLRDACK